MVAPRFKHEDSKDVSIVWWHICLTHGAKCFVHCKNRKGFAAVLGGVGIIQDLSVNKKYNTATTAFCE